MSKISIPGFVYNDLKIIVNEEFSNHLKNKDKLDSMIFIEKKIKVLLAKYVVSKHSNDRLVDHKRLSHSDFKVIVEGKEFNVFGYTDKDEIINIDLTSENDSYFIKFSNQFKQGEIVSKVAKKDILKKMKRPFDSRAIRLPVRLISDF
jgi:hypothetical protein